jgi:putative transposase
VVTDANQLRYLRVSRAEPRPHCRIGVTAAWRQFLNLLEYKAELYGTHVVQVEAAGTTKECASCGVETDKPIWVREHSCPSCGFEVDRDANAAMNVLQRGFAALGLGWPESMPVETALPTGTARVESVSGKRVIETGSPTRNERTASAVSE